VTDPAPLAVPFPDPDNILQVEVVARAIHLRDQKGHERSYEHAVATAELLGEPAPTFAPYLDWDAPASAGYREVTRQGARNTLALLAEAFGSATGGWVTQYSVERTYPAFPAWIQQATPTTDRDEAEYELERLRRRPGERWTLTTRMARLNAYTPWIRVPDAEPTAEGAQHG
jgi:hypothetical protein